MHFQNVNKILNILKKNRELHSLGIFKIIHSKKRGYLNIYQVLFHNTLQQSTF